MRRLIVVAVLLLTMVIGSGGAAASPTRSGCQAYGQAIAAEAQANGGEGAEVRTLVPLNDDVVAFMTALCGS